jgi:hypothetical protein
VAFEERDDELVLVEDRRHPEPAEHQQIEQVHRVAGEDVQRSEQQHEAADDQHGDEQREREQPHVGPVDLVAGVTSRTTANAIDCSMKCISALPTLASGSTARGNFTLPTSGRSP